MVSLKKVETALEAVGMKNKFIGRAEVKELCHILSGDEKIYHAINGHYEGGFAMLVVTDRRILLIDKKPWFLTMEDIRYDMVSEVDFFARLLDSSVHLNLLNKKLVFTSWRQNRMRDLVRYIQHRVMDVNHRGEAEFDQDMQSDEGFQAAAPKLANQSQTVRTNDFAASYQTKIKQHSMAHVAGRIAVDIAQRKRPIIRPLYPRPSLITRYGRSNMATNSRK